MGRSKSQGKVNLNVNGNSTPVILAFPLSSRRRPGPKWTTEANWAPAFAGVTHEAPSFPRTREPSVVERKYTEHRHWVAACAGTTDRDRVLRLHASDE